MITIPFQMWAIKHLSFVFLDGPEKKMVFTKNKVWFYPLRVWYQVYCRIIYLNGDWTKSVLWTRS